MRLTNVFGGRPAFYDRNPLDLGFLSDRVAQAPHGAFDSQTYTVPTARSAYLGGAALHIRRVTAATTPADYEALIRVTGAGERYNVRSGQNVAGVLDRIAHGMNVYLKAGDVVTCRDQDASTAGTCDFYIAYGGTEFDA